jgi:hypothetical protein
MAAPALPEISRWLTAAGQTLFDTPNAGEGGWPGDQAWVTPPDRLAIRYQLPIVLSGQAPPLGIRLERRVQAPAIVLKVGTSLQTASSGGLIERLDPAPGLDRSAIERTASTMSPTARRFEIIRRVMMTPEYQVA